MAFEENAELRQQIAACRLMLELLTTCVREAVAAEGEARGAASARLLQTVEQVRRFLPTQHVQTRQPNATRSRLRPPPAERVVT